MHSFYKSWPPSKVHWAFIKWKVESGVLSHMIMSHILESLRTWKKVIWTSFHLFLTYFNIQLHCMIFLIQTFHLFSLGHLPFSYSHSVWIKLFFIVFYVRLQYKQYLPCLAPCPFILLLICLQVPWQSKSRTTLGETTFFGREWRTRSGTQWTRSSP